ncbi:FAD-dependent oxidoreductase [Agrococcus sp. DT81.2]|uniref:FAD-dependent oxidoreductase n=1 Tax=Agrococcus sp. DT81.2 TaxID=3393414 RepID=UPI003CE553C3
MRVVIVGGVAAGMSAATRLRRLDEHAEIVVLERGEHVSFANCGLPYHVGGVIESRDALLLQSPEALHSRFGIDVRTLAEAVRIDRASRVVEVRDLRSGQLESLPYDRLVLATGAEGLEPLPGDGTPVRELRTIDDMDAIIRVLDAAPAGARVVVVGGGFIGLEATENLVRRGQSVMLVTRGDRPMTRLDPELAEHLSDALGRHGVDLRVRTSVSAVGEGSVELDDGTTVAAALVVDARGVRPSTRLAELAGLALGPSGGVATDEQHRTSDPAILAVGDVAEQRDAIDGTASLMALAGLANRGGREAADAIAGRPGTRLAALGTAIVQVFDRTAVMVGWNETTARASGIEPRVIHTHPSHHAGYYPGAEQMSMKLVVDPADDRILGAQIVGGDGVDRRIDIIAVAMRVGLPASALTGLELAYSPQFGAAKDPVNTLGMVAENRASGLATAVQWHELEAAMDAGATLVDVRTSPEHERSSIPGALSIPLDELRGRLDELSGRDVVVHCQVGQRGHVAQRILAQHGIAARNLDGGWLTWQAGDRARTRALEMEHA